MDDSLYCSPADNAGNLTKTDGEGLLFEGLQYFKFRTALFTKVNVVWHLLITPLLFGLDIKKPYGSTKRANQGNFIKADISPESYLGISGEFS